MAQWLKRAKPYRPDEWFADCPWCGELCELGDKNQAKVHIEEPIDCTCGAQFLVEDDFE